MKHSRIIGSIALVMLFAGVTALASAADMMKEKPAMNTDQSPMMKEQPMTKEQPMMKEQPMTGMLSGSQNHHASGKVAIGKGMKGHTTLTLSDIKVDKVPDGYVYLAKDGDWRNGLELGMLKQFSGTVSFDLPMNAEAGDYNSVVIWCKKYNVEIGRADLSGKMM